MRSLILYYTYHGNTQRIAERIHAAIGGDIARIDTVAAYTGDYDDVVAQGEREVKQGYLPPLKPMGIDLDRYDTIVLGHARLVVHLLPCHACLSDCARPQRQDCLPLCHEWRLARPLDPGYAGAVPGRGVPPGAGRAL